MLPPKENELITRVGAGTPMGETMRRYWIPACLSSEIAEPDSPPARVRLLGEDLVAFRDSDGRIGLIDEFCPHRRVSLFFGRNEECGLRCVYHGWKFDVEGNVVDMSSEPAGSAVPIPRCDRSKAKRRDAGSAPRARRGDRWCRGTPRGLHRAAAHEPACRRAP